MGARGKAPHVKTPARCPEKPEGGRVLLHSAGTGRSRPLEEKTMVIRQGARAAALASIVAAMLLLSTGTAHAQRQCPAGSGSGSSTGTTTGTTTGTVTAATTAQVQLQNALLA